jgi:hypothetical protein
MVALATAPVRARAQSTESVLAEGLFREARDLMDAGKVVEACGKFAESYRLDRALGTLINLAVCHEKEGKTATAWAELNEAAAAAGVARDDREGFVRKRIAALAPEVPRLRLVIAQATSELPSLEVKIDGHVLGSAAWSSPLPIDPGEHRLGVTAEGKQPHTAGFSIPKGAGTTTLSLPALADADIPRSAPPPAAPDDSAGRTQRWVALGVGGAGVIGFLVGTGFGLRAIGLKDDRDARCGPGNVCDAEGVEKDADARDAAAVSTVGFVAGAALVAGGVALYLTAPRSNALRVGIGARGVVLGGTF